MHNLLYKVLVGCWRLVRGVANRVLDKNRIRPREFSNAMLRKYSKHLRGSVINISGWKDADGIGGHYRDYFSNAQEYTISNVGGQGKGFGSAGSKYKEIELDLTANLPRGLEQSFDVVFNHTTLEHIYEFKKAFSNICKLSRDVVIIVVPVMQQVHHTADFGDWWRPTTMTIAKMFKENGFEPMILKCNDQPFAPIYCFAIASRNPEKYKNKFEFELNFEMGKYNYGSSLKRECMSNLIK